MRLSHLTITNHARVPDVDLEVGDHLVLVGPNGCGKSSLLRSLSLMTSGLAVELYEYFTVDTLRDPSRPLEMDVVMTHLDAEEQGIFAEEVDTDPASGLPRLCFHMQVAVAETGPDAETVLIQRTFPQAGKNGRGGDPTRPPRRRQLRAMGVHYLRAQRRADEVDIDGTLRELVAAQDLDERTPDALRRRLEQFDAVLDDDTAITALRDRIAEYINSTRPHPLGRDDVRVRGAGDPERPFAGLRLVLLTSNGRLHPAADHSDGMRQMLAISLHDLAHASASTVIIDEPEVHLHPTSQRAAAQMLNGTKNQKIIATHSPFIVQAFEPQHVVAMTNGRCTRTDPDQEFSNRQKVKAHWWSPHLLEALTTRRVVFVEGIADRLVVLAAAAALGVDLQERGVLVFELRGASNFSAVHGLLGPHGFDLPWSGLVDTDHARRWRQVAERARRGTGELVHVCSPDLEEEYCRALGPQRVLEALERSGVATRRRRAAAVDPESGVSAAAGLAELCREHKVDAALAVSEALQADDVERLNGVWALLTGLGPDGPAARGSRGARISLCYRYSHLSFGAGTTTPGLTFHVMSDDDASLLAAFRRTLASDPELAGLAAEPSADMTELSRLVREWIGTHPDDEDAAERAALTQYLEHLTLAADRAGARSEG